MTDLPHDPDRLAEVDLWSCPKCAFTFDAIHRDVEGGGYSCPACAELELAGKVEDLRAEVAQLQRYRSLGQIPRLDLLLADNDRLSGWLRRLEWAGAIGGELCPVCEGIQDQGHEPGCELVAELRRNSETTRPGPREG